MTPNFKLKYHGLPGRSHQPIRLMTAPISVVTRASRFKQWAAYKRRRQD